MTKWLPILSMDDVFDALVIRSAGIRSTFFAKRAARPAESLSAAIAVTRFAVMKHLRLLEEAGLVTSPRRDAVASLWSSTPRRSRGSSIDGSLRYAPFVRTMVDLAETFERGAAMPLPGPKTSRGDLRPRRARGDLDGPG